MSDDRDEMSGVLFRNERKESDRHPDYKGSAQVAGVQYWLSAWINTSKAGQKYMALKLSPKDAAPAAAPPAPTDFDDEIPF